MSLHVFFYFIQIAHCTRYIFHMDHTESKSNMSIIFLNRWMVLYCLSTWGMLRSQVVVAPRGSTRPCLFDSHSHGSNWPFASYSHVVLNQQYWRAKEWKQPPKQKNWSCSSLTLLILPSNISAIEYHVRCKGPIVRWPFLLTARKHLQHT